MSDDHTTKLDTPLLPAIRERAGAHFSFTEDRPSAPRRYARSGSDWLEPQGPMNYPSIEIRVGDDLLRREYCQPDLARLLCALGNACLDRSALLRKLDALAEKAQAVVDSEGDTLENRSCGSLIYDSAVNYDALRELKSALAEART